MTGPLLACAIGDAYGMGFEFAPPWFVKEHNDPKKGYAKHPTRKQDTGKYGDDFQMSLALAELLCRKDPFLWTHFDVADAFVSAFHRDPRVGYSKGFYKVLVESPTAEALLKTVIPSKKTSGGAMRAAILGVLPGPFMVRDAAIKQASLTHATQDGTRAAAGAALMFHYAYHNLGPKCDMPNFVEDFLPISQCESWAPRRRCYVPNLGMAAVRAALTAVVESSSLTQVLQTCVSNTGDVDTVAAIAMPTAAVCLEVRQDLPSELINGLESGPYGRGYIEMMDAKLSRAWASLDAPKVPPTEPDDADDADDEGVLGALFSEDGR